jgi:hypothetical protein
MGPLINTDKTLFGPMRVFRLAAYLPTLGHYVFIGDMLGWDKWVHTYIQPKTLFGPMRYFHLIAVQLHDGLMRGFRPEDYLPILSHYMFIGGLLGWHKWAHT